MATTANLSSKFYKKVRDSFTSDRANHKLANYAERLGHIDTLIEKLEQREDAELCFKDSKSTNDVDGMYEALCTLCESGLIATTDSRLSENNKVFKSISANYGEQEMANLVPDDSATREFKNDLAIVEIEFCDDIAELAPKGVKRAGTGAKRQKSAPVEVKSPKQKRNDMRLFDNIIGSARINTYEHLLLRLEYGKEGREIGKALSFNAYFDEVPSQFLLEKLVDERDYERKYIGKFIPVADEKFRKRFREGETAVLEIRTDINQCSYPLKRIGVAVVDWTRIDEESFNCVATVKLNVEDFIEYRAILTDAMKNIKAGLMTMCKTHMGCDVMSIEVRFSKSCFKGIDRQADLMVDDAAEVDEFIERHRMAAIEAEAAAKLKAETKAKNEAEKEMRRAEREARREERQRAEAEKAENAFQSDLTRKIEAKKAELGRNLTKEEILSLLNPDLVAQVQAEMASEKK